MSNILIVDDNERNGNVLNKMILALEHNPILVNNGLSALSQFEKQSIDLVLLDILMTEMDGYEVLERIKNNDNLRHIPVIMISAVDEFESVVRCIEKGADDYLLKPFNPTLLKARISACLEKKQHHDLAQQLLKHTESQLIHSEKMASVGQLAAGVAHEINNPIGFIHSNLFILSRYMQDIKKLIKKYEEMMPIRKVLLHSGSGQAQKDKDQEKTLQELDDLKQEIDLEFLMGDLDNIIKESQEGTERVKKIVKDLQEFCHVDESKLRYADINKVLERTLNIVWNEIKCKAEVTKDYGEIPEILCYPMQLNQVFINIMVNAAQSMEKRGEIKVSTEYDGKKNQIEICIKDTGSGISAENIKKIFNPFFTTKKVGGGTGLGLSMAYGIINSHKGKIEVKSEQATASEFIIKLPVRRIEN